MSLPTLFVFRSDNLNGRRVSSAPSYDEHLSAIFPYYVMTDLEAAEDLTDTLSMGDEDGIYPSFASVANLAGHRQSKVMWLSAASLALVLAEHEGLDYDFIVESVITEGALTTTTEL